MRRPSFVRCDAQPEATEPTQIRIPFSRAELMPGRKSARALSPRKNDL